MRTSVLTTAILLWIIFIFPVVSLAQVWEWQQPLPQGNSLISVDWAGASSAIAVGGKGTILLTTDGGATWTVKHFIPDDVGLKDVSFIDPNTATCVGVDGTIIRTTDGGNSWTEQTSGVTSSLNSVDFPDINTGYTVGHYGIILKTTDGGTTWIPQTSGSSAHLVAVSFSDTSTGSTVGSGGTILRTINGGTTWVPQTSGTTNTLLGVYFTDADTGMAVGSDETALLTTNGGATWTPQTLPSRPPGDIFALQDVFLVDGQTAYATGYYQDMVSLDIGYVLQTFDGGATWNRVYSDDGGQNFLYAVSFANANVGLAVGALGTIHQTTDGGANWSKTGGAVMDLTMEGVDFIDANNGVAVSMSSLMGGIGEVYYTDDGGNVWHGVRASDVFGPCKFYDVTYATADTVWAVGLGDEFDSIFATFFKSTDGGFSYDIHAYQLCIPPYCMVEYTPRAISFGDPNHGVAVGNLGIVWTIRDPYVSEVASGTSKQLWGVSMPDSMTAVAVGDSGTIIVSTNGGDSWTPQVSGVSENLYAVSFVTPFIGTAVGAWGTILRTTDGGTTWIPQVSGTTAWLHGVDFLDKNNGVVVGAAIALVTTDGGVNWTVEQVPTTSRLNDVALMPGRTVAVGNGQVILNRKYSLVGTQRPPTISFQLYQNHPNPFNPSTTIRYDLPKPARVVLRIYDVKGRLVRTLLSPTWKEAGQHTELWDGLNNRGDHVASGIYFYRLTAGNRSLAKKMVLLR